MVGRERGAKIKRWKKCGEWKECGGGVVKTVMVGGVVVEGYDQHMKGSLRNFTVF